MENKNRFYVYLHRKATTGVVFYIGKGSAGRASTQQFRNKDWHKEAEEDYFVEFLHENLTSEDAYEKEAGYLLNPLSEWKLVNKLSSQQTKKMDFNLFNEYFYYDETSPTFIRKKKIHKFGPKCEIGTPVGILPDSALLPQKSPQIRLDRKIYKISRVVYLLHHKVIDPNSVIDHIDGNRFNNNISNLREVCYSVNAKNRLTNKVDPTMFHILYCEMKKPNRTQIAYQVNWTKSNGKRTKKFFMICSIRTKEEALTLAKAFRDDLIKQGLILTRGI